MAIVDVASSAAQLCIIKEALHTALDSLPSVAHFGTNTSLHPEPHALEFLAHAPCCHGVRPPPIAQGW